MYLEKKKQYQVQVNILKGKLEEKGKILRFQDSATILDNILSSERSPTIKSCLGFHGNVKGESSSQAKARNSNAKSEILNKEIISQPLQQPRKGSLQRK